MPSFLVGREDYELAKPQSYLVGVTPERVDRDVANKMKGGDVGVGPSPAFVEDDEFPRVFVFLRRISDTGVAWTYMHIAAPFDE